jgi:hypothetical protein
LPLRFYNSIIQKYSYRERWRDWPDEARQPGNESGANTSSPAGLDDERKRKELLGKRSSRQKGVFIFVFIIFLFLLLREVGWQ